MDTIRVVLEAELLEAVDRTAARLKLSRSALFREALRDYLRSIRVRERETADRAGYEQSPEQESEFAAWDRATVWPRS